MEDDVVYTVTRSRILKGATVCSAARTALKEMFPEAFEKPALHVKAGTIFRIVHFEEMDTHLSKDYLDPEDDLTFLVILIHEKAAHEYRLVHLTTGYRFNSKIYRRTPKGVEVFKEDLKGLIVYREGGGK